VIVSELLRPKISESIREALHRRETDHFAISVSDKHVHLLMQTELGYEELKLLAGKLKTISSLSIRSELPGNVWARGGYFGRIESENHFNATRHYITRKQEPGAFVWDFELGSWWMT